MRSLVLASVLVACGGGDIGGEGVVDDSSTSTSDSTTTTTDTGAVVDTTVVEMDTTVSEMDSTTASETSTEMDSSVVTMDSAMDTKPVDSATDTSKADSVADTFVADTAVADTAVADTAVADTTVADTSVADTTPTDTGTATGVTVGPCRIFPTDNAWNTDISGYPLHSKNAAILGTMATSKALHADWGTFTEGYGIPINVGTGAPPQKMTWTVSWGAAESDKLPCSDGYQWCYPIPSSCKIEGPSDSHLLFLDTAGAPNNCTLYELWQTQPWISTGWRAANGAIFKLGTNTLRPDGWTSADAAGLPILPGLIRYDEVKAGAIKHAIRFTMVNTFQGYIHPATHAAGSTTANLPPMGLRLRLKSSVAIGSYTKEAQTILQAFKTYGIILADNGSDWYFTGEEHDGWATSIGGGKTVQDGIITAFNAIHGSDFEIVDTGPTSTAGL
jgi:hypothetical protein